MSVPAPRERFLASAQRTVALEIEAVQRLHERLDDSFERACEIILACDGRVVVTGMGKSGHIGHKIAATLASTGTPAFYVHPAEASHGDIGMITGRDVVLALSNSGATPEVLAIVPLIKRMGAHLIAMTGKPDSSLARFADVALDAGVAVEACPLGLAPTSSTTVALVMGDALAIALLEARGFSAEDFAFSHPGGMLGRKLLLRVDDIMHQGREVPRVPPATRIREALLEMTAKGFGMTTITDDAGRLLGVFTDGDLRRAIDRGIDFHVTPIADFMTTRCKTVTGNALAAQALHMLEEGKITSLVVVDDEYRPTGVIHLHDLLRAGIA
ncbi:MAG TPA: KpsF/GutQ family sugar-phosphate isomerase [Pseudomonadales bacterium]|nr:KpsF/GutQ family sugar-phosphate isomerase [Pseudomonadales bacterium]HNC69077.1 KpsF/GutQ family sugar-phosphate isomerase [Pseudomonadales bacterium]HND13706.1 KpsF/GutQ family sugar-phosphate isomerase [Pseudomonadales bacterium]